MRASDFLRRASSGIGAVALLARVEHVDTEFGNVTYWGAAVVFGKRPEADMKARSERTADRSDAVVFAQARKGFDDCPTVPGTVVSMWRTES